MIAPVRNPKEKPAKWPFKPLKVPKARASKTTVIRSEALERHLAEKEQTDG